MTSETMRDDFKSAVHLCRRALIIFSSFPFFVVGRVIRTSSSYVAVKFEFGVPQELIDLLFRIRFDSIQAYFVETDKHKIPEFDHDKEKAEYAEK